MKKKLIIAGIIVIIVAILVVIFSTGVFQNKLDTVKGNLIGHSFVIEAYDGYGEPTLTVSGKSVAMEGNRTGDDLTSVITITVDGDAIETCGDTLIFAEKGLVKEVDFAEDLSTSSRGISSISLKINEYANKFGKSRIIVIKSQMGQPLAAYSGNKVYWEIVDDLPKTTKLMIDGKALYIHRANFQIIDKALVS